MNLIQQIFKTQFDFLIFRSICPNLKDHFRPYMSYVVITSWLVGIGRYWDHPNAEGWQYAGLGSVAYIFVLSIVLYLLVKPLNPKNWSFNLVLVFVGLTALPGLLYAIPVERFMSMEDAQVVNAWFLGVVAVWRVALYVNFIVVVARLSIFRLLVATLLPLSAILAALALLNLEHVVFEIMAGIRPEDATPNDLAYVIVFWLTLLAYFAFPVTGICYIAAIVKAQIDRKKQAK